MRIFKDPAPTPRPGHATSIGSQLFAKGSVESTHKVPTSHTIVEKGSVESTHKVPTSHYHNMLFALFTPPFIDSEPPFRSKLREQASKRASRHNGFHGLEDDGRRAVDCEFL